MQTSSAASPVVRRRPRAGAYGLRIAVAALVAALGTACPRATGPRGPRGAADALPRVAFSVQIDGNPWPIGRRGDGLYLWSVRRAAAGFLFPIRLLCREAADGAARWAIPIRPWLHAPGLLGSVTVARSDGTLGAWVKGEVVRVVREADGEDLWSLPQALGLAAHGRTYAVFTRAEALLIDGPSGRERGRLSLGAAVRAQLAAAPGFALLRLDSGDLTAVDLATGRIAWRARPRWASAPLASAPRATAKTVFIPVWRAVGPGNRKASLMAIRRNDGGLAWERVVPAPAPPSGGPATAPVRFTVAGGLIFWPLPRAGCLRALDLGSGADRFTVCGLHLESLPVAVGPHLFALGADPRATEAVREGLAWYAVDYPLVTIDRDTGRAAPLSVGQWRGRRERAPLRALRLPLSPRSSRFLYYLGRDRFLTALQVAP